MVSRAIFGIFALAATTAVAAWFWQRDAPEILPLLPQPTLATALEPSDITVHVAGAVVSPGLVQVGEWARVADAISAAGGARRDADIAAVNLAAPVADGQQIVIPVRGRSASGGESRQDGKVAINRATASELEALPGVGPVLAARIADHRDVHGPFAAVEDLLDVPGIGEGKLATLRDSVVVP